MNGKGESQASIDVVASESVLKVWSLDSWGDDGFISTRSACEIVREDAGCT